jgi:glycosyltransferase involved in cell wall biosynthesis
MSFPVTYLLDHLAPSETFIRRELEQLRRRSWPVFTRLLNGGVDPLRYALASCPEGFRWRFAKAAYARISEEFFRAPLTALRMIKHLPQAAYLAKKVVDSDSRLIHSHFAGITADLAAIVSRALGVPWTCSVHAHDVFTTSSPALRRRLRTASRVTACSRRAVGIVAESGYPAEKIDLIHHGLPINEFAFDTIQTDEVIFTAARLEAKKGIDTLIRACAQLRDRNVRFTCVIAGAGPLLGSLKKLVARLELEKSIVFIGWQSQEETRSHLMDASVLALPSRRTRLGDSDGIPNILVEALALGTPIITTTASSANEIILDTVNGLLVPPDDPARLADALATALASKELRIRMAKAGRLTAEQYFDGSKNIQQLEAFFASAVGSTASAAL